MESENYRAWEYKERGDYHKNLDPNWSYAPTYLRKMHHMRNWLESLDPNARILDAGCGEGVLVEEYSKKGRNIEGLDLNYESRFVQRGSVLQTPYEDNRFDAVLLLDVFEHLSFTEQPKALDEIRRILRPGGWLVAYIPNLAHLNSRIEFLLRGRLDRTDVDINHIGERPEKENANLLKRHGYEVVSKHGITLTVPWLYRKVICRNPSKYMRLHDLLDKFAVPSLAMVTMYYCRVAG